ncbi:MAG: hypothetical protein D6730_05270 [Bacteroidetes bacterium]|nr:MAG: hypothetical protein D6730_05270 [Bacteroidota bacterium]
MMYYTFISFILVTLTFTSMSAQSPKIIKAVANETVEVRGDLSEGALMEDLSWAWNSSVACFPETQKHKFSGNHVLYTTGLPRYSEMEVTVIPDDPRADFSIYAYEVGLNNESVVPNLSSCIRCEVDHKWDRNYVGKRQDHTRTAKHLVAINNPYRVVIGVVGANGLQEGAYTLQVKLKSR